MKGKKQMNKSALAVSLSLFLVLLLLIGTFVFSQMKRGEDAILLPIGPADTDVMPTPEAVIQDTMLQVTPDNVVKVLQTLKRPAYYFQRLDVLVGAQPPQAMTHVNLWANGTQFHAECTTQDTTRVKSVLTDGKTAWIWYDTDFVTTSVELSHMSLDDLLGLPGFDYLEKLQEARIEDAAYELFEGTTRQCVYVKTAEQDGRTEEYWVDLKTGLLQSVRVTEGEEAIYELRSGGTELLGQGDSSYDGRFCLPDGTRPFTETE